MTLSQTVKHINFLEELGDILLAEMGRKNLLTVVILQDFSPKHSTEN